jgi:hypothetical protein
MSAPKKYSVYDRETDLPIVIYKSAQECAEALGMEYQSFRTAYARQKAGRPSHKWEIFEDEICDLGDD